MNPEVKKVLSAVISVLILISVIPFAFADDTPVLYVKTDKTDCKVELEIESKQAVNRLDYKFTAKEGVTVTSCLGQSVGNDNEIISILSSESTFVSGNTRYFSPETGKIKVGSFEYTVSQDLKDCDFEDLFTFSDTKINGVNAVIKLKTVTDGEEELSEYESETAYEYDSEHITEPVSEEVSQKTDEPSSEPESQTEPAPIPTEYFPSVNAYIYENPNGEFFAAVSFDTDGADSIAFDIKPFKSAFVMGDPVITDKNNGIAVKKDGNVISVTVSDKNCKSYILIPLTFTSDNYAYLHKDSLFTLDYCFVNSVKKPITLNTEIPEFNPVDKNSSYFKGFDATYNTYEDGEDKYFSYKLYAVSLGFAYDMQFSFNINSNYDIIGVKPEKGFSSTVYENVNDISHTVAIRTDTNSPAKLEYTPIATVFFTYNNSETDYTDLTDNIYTESLKINGTEYKDCDLTFKVFSGYGYHYDSADGILYTSVDYDNQPRYTAVSGYTEEADSDIVIPEVVRDGYVVAAIDDGAFKDCTLGSIELPDTVEKIGKGAFENCTSLTSITIPGTVYSIGDESFKNCTSLDTVNFKSGKSLETIGKDAFLNCPSYTDIILPDGSYTIGNHAFGFDFDNGEYILNENAKIYYKTLKSPAIAYCDEYGVAYMCVDEKDLIPVKGEEVTVFFNDAEKYILLTAGTDNDKISDIEESRGFYVCDKNGRIATNDKLCTGMTAVFEDEIYDIVIKGDVDGNGKVSVADARTVLRSVAKLSTLTGAYSVAADTDRNGSINTADARRMLRVVAKLEQF